MTGLLVLILGLALFIAPHVFVTMRDRRAALIGRWGAGPYRLVFSLVSVIGVLVIAYGFGLYRSTGWIDVWNPPRWTRHLAVTLVLVSVVMVAAAYSPPNHIKAALKHPMLAGVKVWALAHLLANGDLGSIVLFGSILAWAVFDRIAVKRRAAAGEAAPVVAPSGWSGDAIAVVAGVAVFLALGFLFHPLVVGVPVFSG